MPPSMHLRPESHPPTINHGTKYSAKITQWVFNDEKSTNHSFEEFLLLVHINSGFPSIQIGSTFPFLFVCSEDRGVSQFCASLLYLKWIMVPSSVRLFWLAVGSSVFCFFFFFPFSFFYFLYVLDLIVKCFFIIF